MKNILDFIENDTSKLTLDVSSILIFKEKFINFSSNKFEIDIFKNYGFSISIMYSVDSQNWSLPKSIVDFEDEIEYYKNLAEINDTEFYCYLKLFINKIDVTNNTYNQFNKNSGNYFPEIIFEDITYQEISLIKTNQIEIEHYVDVINKFPSWNLYDNQQVNIDRWLSECVAVVNRTGHQCIYFKTEPDKNEIEFTLNSLTKRDVAGIKKLMFSCPDNELPSDRNIFSEWDMPMIDDFVIHIPDLLFKLIFGNEIPSSKDFIYLPILNKVYTINSVQPGTKFMGVTGWWECYLIKYEDDENVNKPKRDDEDNLMLGINSIINTIPNLDEQTISDLYDQFENVIDDGMITADKNLKETIEEKKEVTNNFSNKLVDSTSYISLKETENQRKFYNKRLKIVTINPDSLSFPLNMYDASTIDLRKIGLTYDLLDATKINKFSTTVNNTSNILITFNFVFLKRFTSEIIDFLYNDSILFSIKIKGKNIIILKDSIEYIVNYKFEEDFFYQINITHKDISIFQLENKTKTLKHIFEYTLFNNINNVKLSSINIYGGLYYLGQFILKINNNKILDDKTLPVLNMNSFGI